ncbi:MAG: long-chain fatty acid--CoA ligase, partial [Polyangiales bacterium]
TEGELLVRGPSVFPGYDDDERATRAAFTDGDPARGFFRTGDSVVIETGVGMRVRGRLSVDVLKSGGYKISALEIEEVLRAHPAVADVAVVGLPDPEWGDLVTAAIVVRAGMTLDEATLRAFARDRLAPYKVPKRVVFVEVLLRNVVGKVVKPSLVAALSSALAR